MFKPLFLSSETGSVAVLTPHEWHLIRDQLNSDYKIRGDFLLHTAMRIREAQYVASRPECYRKENRAIFLPRVKEIGKPKCVHKNRAIMLSDNGVDAVDTFFKFNSRIPSYQAMEPTFKLAGKNAGCDPKLITTKMLRKTYVSWLMTCFPDRQIQIAHSAGHDFNTMTGHYLLYGFARDDIRDMREELKGWGTSA